nr:hypothetical protein CFP56_08514 [Quercus suber]
MLEEQLKGNMENGVFKDPMWQSITAKLNKQTKKSFPHKKVVHKHNRLRLKQRKWSQLLKHTGLGWDEHTQTVIGPDEVWANMVAAANLRKQGCPDHDKLHQLFTPSTATGNLQISSNTPTLNSDEERALEEELANASAPTHLNDDCYTPNFESVSQIVEDTEVEEPTQRKGKPLVQDGSGKGNKVSKKMDRVSDMIVALKEYTAMMKERFSGKWGKSNGTSEQFA